MKTALTEEQIDKLGPEILPFERRERGFKGIIKEGEAIPFDDFIHNVTVSGPPKDIFIVLFVDILNNSPLSGKYLWIIDKAGFKILLEATPNAEAERRMICHTNITGGMPALQGGELWFGDDGRVYINNKSGRYGAHTTVQEDAVIAYFVSLGLDAIQLPF